VDAVPDAGGLASVLAATRARAPRPRPPRRRSRAVWVAVGAAAVAIGLIAALLVGAFEGLHIGLPASSSPPSPSAGPSSYYGALPAANAAARALYWDWPSNGEPPLVFAEGLASPVRLGAVVNASHLGTANCAPTLLSTSIPALPAYNASVTGGIAPGWLFAFTPGAGSLLVLAVVNGTASIVASSTSSGACYYGPGAFNTVVVDSSVAASAAGATQASRGFLGTANASGDPVSADFYLVPPGYLAGTPLEPMWIVNDTTCALYGGPAGSGTTLTSEVNAATGRLYAQSAATVAC
jgi:hypothetical protein